MGEYVLIYASDDSDSSQLSKKRAKEVGGRAIGVPNVPGLLDELSRLKRSGIRIGELHFFTEGNEGNIHFGSSYLHSTDLHDFAGKGFEDLFDVDARVYFDGCNVAAVKSGCSVGRNCAANDNGVVFLKAVAKTFLFRGGGRAVGWTSTGLGFPGLGGTKIHHWWGQTVQVMISQGGTRTRIAVGSYEFYSPEGEWEVERDRQIAFYSFRWPTVYCGTNKYDSAKDSGEAGRQRGICKLHLGALRIDWDSHEYEIWDMPLFPHYQTGVAFDTLGFDIPVYARRWPL